MADYRKMIVETAAKFIGTREPDGDDQFIKAYNKSVGTNFNMQTAWCAMFVTYCARMAGVPTSVIPNFASCTASRDSFWKPKGQWHLRNSGYTPQPGDLIFYNWSKNLSGPPQHVGIVRSVANGKVTTIEGNTSNPAGKTQYDGVYSKNYALTSQYILAYASPAYPGATAAPAPSETKVSSLVKPNKIREFQTWLNTNYGSGLAVDGVFGAASRRAVVKAWQTQMNSTYKSKLVVDGIFGTACKNAANRRIITTNSRGKIVSILQGMLYAHGYDPKGMDGICGLNTFTAIKSFQRARKLEVDGEVGPATWESLFNRW